MTAFTSITNAQVDAESPVTTTLLTALRDNPTAIAEGDPTAPRVKPVIIHVQDQRAAGNNGNSLTVGDFRDRTLQTVVTNTITGASLASSTGEITLPAGTYDVTARVPFGSSGGGGGSHKSQLWNSTDSVEILLGSPSIYPNSVTTDSWIKGRFTLASAKAVKVRTRPSQTDTAGLAYGVGSVEIYTDIMIEKVG